MIYKYYIELIQCALTKESPSPKAISSISLPRLYHFAELNKLTPLMVNLSSHWTPASQQEQELLSYWKADATDCVFLEYKKFSLVKQLFSLAEKRKLSLTLFKGYFLANLYPDFTLRGSSDTDILIPPSQLTEVTHLLQELHYSHATDLDSPNVSTFLYKENDFLVHKIELHTSLFEDMQGSEIAFLESLSLSSPEKNISFACCGAVFKTLNHQEHLIYQIFHMVKHFCCHGFPARYLIDIALFTKEYHSVINWNEIEKIMFKLGYSCFYRQLFSIVILYFDAPKNILGSQTLCNDAEIQDLLIDILHFGMRSCNEVLSHYFYYFEKHIEHLEAENGALPDTITYDGETVPTQLVPLSFQREPILQKRIQLLRTLKLI